MLANKEIELMKIEARLDRIQVLLGKKDPEPQRARQQVLKALGEVRSVLEYHTTNRQKTLRFWQPRPEWKTHMSKYKGC